MQDEPVLCLFSGGIDSTVLLWNLLRRHKRVTALSINYDGRPTGEINACHKIASMTRGVGLIDVTLSGLAKPADSNGYIPGRNLIFYSIAASVCEKNGIRTIVGGQIKTDHIEFSDASSEYIMKIKSVLTHDCYPELDILLPLIDMDKDEVIRTGLSIGTPLELTWSCHADVSIQCGRCSGCFERIRHLDPVLFRKSV